MREAGSGGVRKPLGLVDDHGARLNTTGDRGRQTVGRPPRAQSRINGGCAGSSGVIACATQLAQDSFPIPAKTVL
jgi:hypothetical protein